MVFVLGLKDNTLRNVLRSCGKRNFGVGLASVILIARHLFSGSNKLKGIDGDEFWAH